MSDINWKGKSLRTRKRIGEKVKKQKLKSQHFIRNSELIQEGFSCVLSWNYLHLNFTFRLFCRWTKVNWIECERDKVRESDDDDRNLWSEYCMTVATSSGGRTFIVHEIIVYNHVIIDFLSMNEWTSGWIETIMIIIHWNEVSTNFIYSFTQFTIHTFISPINLFDKRFVFIAQWQLNGQRVPLHRQHLRVTAIYTSNRNKNKKSPIHRVCVDGHRVVYIFFTSGRVANPYSIGIDQLLSMEN